MAANEKDAREAASCLQKLQAAKTQEAAAQVALDEAIQALAQSNDKLNTSIEAKVAEKRRCFDTKRATAEGLYQVERTKLETELKNALASLKTKRDQERSRLWMEEERQIQEQAQTARESTAKEREPLQEAVKSAQRARDLLQIEVRSQQSTLQIYMPHTETSMASSLNQQKPSQPAKTEEPRGGTSCNLGCSCPWLLTTGKCKFFHTQREKDAVDESRKEWLTSKALVWPEKFGKWRKQMLPEMIFGEHSIEAQEKWKAFRIKMQRGCKISVQNRSCSSRERKRSRNRSRSRSRSREREEKRSRSKERGYDREHISTSKRRTTGSSEKRPQRSPNRKQANKQVGKPKVQVVKADSAKAKPEATTEKAESNGTDTPSPPPEEITTSPKTLATDRAAEASNSKVFEACGVSETDGEE